MYSDERAAVLYSIEVYNAGIDESPCYVMGRPCHDYVPVSGTPPVINHSAECRVEVCKRCGKYRIDF